MRFILALFPILLILYLMVARRWGAARAGAAGYLAAMVLAMAAFGAGAELLAYAHTKALLLAFDVLYIVWMAYVHFRIADEAGAIGTIGSALRQLTEDPGMLALVLGFAFASFLQGIGGFGVPIAIVAPMMVGLGFAPLSAVVIPAIGHSWAVTFGSLGSSFQALMVATGLPGELLQTPAALMLGGMGIGAAVSVAHAADGWRSVRRLWLPLLILSVSMALMQYGLALAGLWNLAATGGGAIGLVISVFLAAHYSGENHNKQSIDSRAVFLAFSGYVALIAIMMLVQLVPPVKNFLGQVALQVEFPALTTSAGFTTPAQTGRVIHWFSHGGAILLYSSVASFWIYRRTGLLRAGAGTRILGDTIKGVLSSSLSITAMVSMAVIMSHAGMTDALAQGMAAGVGAAFPLISPWIGALGAFMTGSNTNSNVVFAALQQRTAEILAISVPWMLAAQTTGGAIGSIIAPTKVVVGAATAGMEGREGEVIKKLAGYVITLVTLLSVISWIVG